MLPRRRPSWIRITAISISLALHVAALLVLTVPWETPVAPPVDNEPAGEPWVVNITPVPKAAGDAPVQPDVVPHPIAHTVPEGKLPIESSPPPARTAPQPPSMEGVDASALYDALGVPPPMESIRAGQDSQVWVVVHINARGEPTQVTIEAGAQPVDKQLEQAARVFIMKSWRFEASAAPTVLRLPLVYF